MCPWGIQIVPHEAIVSQFGSIIQHVLNAWLELVSISITSSNPEANLPEYILGVPEEFLAFMGFFHVY